MIGVSFGYIRMTDNFVTMDKNNATTAPIVPDTEDLFLLWGKSHVGNVDAFYKFMTTPSVDRDSFIEALSPTIKFLGTALCVIIRHSVK